MFKGRSSKWQRRWHRDRRPPRKRKQRTKAWLQRVTGSNKTTTPKLNLKVVATRTISNIKSSMTSRKSRRPRYDKMQTSSSIYNNERKRLIKKHKVNEARHFSKSWTSLQESSC